MFLVLFMLAIRILKHSAGKLGYSRYVERGLGDWIIDVNACFVFIDSLNPGDSEVSLMASSKSKVSWRFVFKLSWTCLENQEIILLDVSMNVLQDVNTRSKVVVALYPFKAIENGDLSLEKVSRCLWKVLICDCLWKILEWYSLVHVHREKNMKSSMILRNIGGKRKTSMGMLMLDY